MTLQFRLKDFEKMQRLEAAFKRQLGNEIYASTNYAALVLNYSPKLVAMLRPFPPQNEIEVDLLEKNCEPKNGKRSPQCYKVSQYLAEKDEQFQWECDECLKLRISLSKKS